MIRIESEDSSSKYGLDADGNTIEDVLGLPEFLIDAIAEAIEAGGALDALNALPVGEYRTDGGYIWVKNADQTWTDNLGHTKPVEWNFILAGTGFHEKVELVK